VIIVIGLVGSLTELLLLQHYEDPWQFVPLALIGAALVTIAAHAVTGSATSLRVLRVLMAAFILAGGAGVVLHFRGNLEFQLEMDSTQSAWALFSKAIRAKAPPALAPGVMAQLGLLGLLYTYRHPALDGRAASHPQRSTT
jgi:hypothetical protein